MRFVCDECGKKYSTAEAPAPGKIYRLKCKACGHPIVVKAMDGTSTAIPVHGDGFEALPLEVASAIDGAAPQPSDTRSDPTPRPAEARRDRPAQPQAQAPVKTPVQAPPQPPPPEMDELGDLADAAAEAMASTEVRRVLEPSGRSEGGLRGAARASLPAGYTGRGSDPFAPQQAEPAAVRAPPRVGSSSPKPVGKGGLPPGMIVVGVAIIAGVTILALLKGGKGAQPPAVVAPAPVVLAPPPAVPVPEATPQPQATPPATATATPPASTTAAPPKPSPAPTPAPRQAAPPAGQLRLAAPAPAPAPPRAQVVERRPEPPAPPAPAVVERQPEPRPQVARPAAPFTPPPAVQPLSPDTQLPSAEAALTPDVVQQVVLANRPAFAACTAQAGPDEKLDGRRVTLKLTIGTTGTVSYPTLDDQSLSQTPMGGCLKNAARSMIFPRFRGEPFHLEVPLALSR